MPNTKVHFSKVKEAREALRERAMEIMESYLTLASQATAANDFKTAERIGRYLIDHITDDEGNRVVDISVDAKQIEAESKGPIINIGFALGGVSAPKELPAAIEVTHIETEPPIPVIEAEIIKIEKAILANTVVHSSNDRPDNSKESK